MSELIRFDPEGRRACGLTKHHQNFTLIIGDTRRWVAEGRLALPLDGFHFVEFRDLTHNVMEEIQPDTVLSPLLCGTCDAIEVAERLQVLQFKGRYRVVDLVPFPDLICQEVDAHAPGLDFAILSITADLRDLTGALALSETVPHSLDNAERISQAI